MTYFFLSSKGDSFGRIFLEILRAPWLAYSSDCVDGYRERELGIEEHTRARFEGSGGVSSSRRQVFR